MFDVVSRVGEANLATLAIGISCILLLLGFTRLSPKAPGPLTMVATATALSFAFGLDQHGVKVLGDVRPAKQWELMGELRRRIKDRFDREGIEIPYPHQTNVPYRQGAPAQEAVRRDAK